jgi:hypothetical protein
MPVPSPPPAIYSFPTVEDVTRRVRIYLNDNSQSGVDSNGNPVYGRIYPDTNPNLIDALTEAVAQLSRDLRNVGWKAAVQEVIIPNIPLIFGANGLGSPDPAAFQNINFNGFFNGSMQIPLPVLPRNLMAPQRLWVRLTNSNTPFADFDETTSGLATGNQQTFPGKWEWRDNAIWWNGATQACDVRLRYTCSSVKYTQDNLQPPDFPVTHLPFIEDAQPLAAWMAVIFSRGRPMVDPTPFMQDYAQCMTSMANEIVRQKQGAPVEREGFGDNDAAPIAGWY